MSDADKPIVLIVDDEEDNLDYLERTLRSQYRVIRAESGEAALQAAHEMIPDVVISDHRMPGITGTELLQKIGEFSPDSARLVLTAYHEVSIAIDAINSGGVLRFLTKPITPDDLAKHVREALSTKKIDQELLAHSAAPEAMPETRRAMRPKERDPVSGLANLRSLQRSLRTPKNTGFAAPLQVRETPEPGQAIAHNEALGRKLLNLSKGNEFRVYRADGPFYAILAPTERELESVREELEKDFVMGKLTACEGLRGPQGVSELLSFLPKT